MEEQLTKDLEAIAADARNMLEGADSAAELESVRVSFLGKKGRLTTLLRGMSKLSNEERPRFGAAANQVRQELETLLSERRAQVERAARARALATERVDVTLPGRQLQTGRRHPLHQVEQELVSIFQRLGFVVVEGPEVELDYYNFEALNLPKGHPARDMQDSFYVTEETLLRTHTSPVQIRYMESIAPSLPVRMICPGRVYRRDDDATHSPMFHQVEGLLVDRDVSFADLKGVLEVFARQVFGPTSRIRLRPSYFPFTEPSAEVDVSCAICGGSGCRTCSDTGWLEILGAGMVHPQVLRNGGYDPEEVSGFAFGMGIERVAMLKYGIDDLRLFYQNDLRFLRQF